MGGAMISDVVSTSAIATMQQVTGIPAVHEENDTTGKGQQEKQAPRDVRPKVEHAVHELNDLVKMLHTSLQFSIDDKTKKIIVKVMDADTQKVIRQIPPEEMVKISARVQELLGVLIDGSA
jgi:flagellar protein FlaG